MGTPSRFIFTCLSFLMFFAAQAQHEPSLEFGCHFTDSPVLLPGGGDKLLTCGSNERSDSIDVLNYDIVLDLTQFGQKITGTCGVTFTAKENPIGTLPLDLLDLTVDSVTWQGSRLAFEYDSLLLNIELPQPVNVGEEMEVVVYYHGLPTFDTRPNGQAGWGGFRYQNGIGYNLGIGLNSNPYNFGRSWHPCFDNFVERATYDINIVTDGDRTGYAVGELMGEENLGGDTISRQYHMGLPLPSYLVGVAASNYSEIHDMHSGANGDYPVLLVGRPGDIADMEESFAYLDDAIDALESWYGPYIWGQVGYVMTPQGAMEHASLIAFPYGSITDGPTYDMNRLMAHELAHQWWGNITTLSCPENMWIKEGNAEYGSHLFQEYAFGRAFFDDVVKDNQHSVLRNAHIRDGGFLALSGIPYEQTYGMHTYNKGAAVMHNLRGYLGDTLFAKGMRSVLDNFRFQAVDAEEMQNQLTAETGIDMAPFFDAWIYQPGFATFELDSMHLEPNGNQWDATLYIQQKLRKAFNFHTNVPLEITFFDENWNTYDARFMVSGEFTEAVVSVPFEPVWQVLNDHNTLNLARMQSRQIVAETGDPHLNRVYLTSTKVNNIPEGDSALVSMVHHWAAPDPATPDQPNLRLSNSHYWTFGGVFPEGFSMETRMVYEGKDEDDLDFDLVSETEDSLILVWRPDASSPWGEYPFYIKQPLGSSNNGLGLIKIETMLPGHYAFANGEVEMATAVSNAQKELVLKMYPNPAPSELNVQAILPKAGKISLSVFDGMGRLLRSFETATVEGGFSEKIDVAGLPAGIYWLEVKSEDGGYTSIEKFVKK
ncbi:MAG TPA: T9SS type A sorting domain-containing protein [Bacteroidetes bacterium]|nr:T9SS type A sorting domain-containing protein [Bacteroidota bacterium]